MSEAKPREPAGSPVDDFAGSDFGVFATLERIGQNYPGWSWFVVVASPSAGHQQAMAAGGCRRLTEFADDIMPGGLPEVWLSDSALFVVLPCEAGDVKPAMPGALPVSGVLVCANIAEFGASAHPPLPCRASPPQGGRSDGEKGGAPSKMLRRLDDWGLRFDGAPMHVLFTGVETLPGFAAFFSGLDPAERQAAWGVSLSDREDRAGREVLNAAFDRLSGQLVDDMSDALHTAVAEKPAILAFPRHFGALKQMVAEFLNDLVALPVTSFHFVSVGEAASGRDFFVKGFFEQLSQPENLVPQKTPMTKARLRRGAVAAMMLLLAALAGLWGWSFIEHRSLVAATRSAIELDYQHNSEIIGQTAVSDVDLENVVAVLSMLRDLPAGTQNHAPTPTDRLGFSQKGKIGLAGHDAYRNALERLFRSRLMLEVEDIVRERMASPADLYQPLKVYLMLGGQAPRVDAELVAAFLRRDWETRLYPGFANRAGRDELETHLRAMLSPGGHNVGEAYLDRPLVEAAQRSLARMDLLEFAWVSINSATYSVGLNDFSVASAAGLQAESVLDTLDGRPLSALSVPALYTHAGFRDFFLNELGAVAEKLVDDQWLMGAGGQQVGVTQQLERLGPRLLDRYGREFAAAWNGVLDNLKLRPLTEDREKFAALAALSSSSSPLRKLVEAIAAETALTSPSEAEQRLSLQQVEHLQQGLKQVGIALGHAKSQIRAGEAFASSGGQMPGGAIETQFRPYRSLVHGDAGRRPIDALVQNFADLRQSIVLAAGAAGQESRASANLQLQVHNLRVNASRLPRELARMVNSAADDFDNDVSEISIAQLNRALSGSIGSFCEEVTKDAYPFVKGGENEASIQDFTRLFAPGGEIDRFFAQNLLPMVDVGVKPWRWRPGSGIADKLSPATLIQFQRAAEIRDAFFPNGGSMPEVAMTITPFSLHEGVDMAVLDISGQIVQSRKTGGSTAEIVWPDAFAAGAAGLSLQPELPGRASAIRFDGPWSLLRLMDAGSIVSGVDGLQLRFVLSGRDVTYLIGIDAKENPFAMPALSEFRCPTRL